MNTKDIAPKRSLGISPSSKWRGLQFRLTRSYMLTTLCSVLLIEIMLGVCVIVLLLYTPILDDEFSAGARLTARQYALTAAVQVGDRALTSAVTFEPGQLASIALPDDDRTNNATRVIYLKTPSGDSLVTFALLIDSTGKVLTSSFPAQYPSGTRITQLLPNLAGFALNGLSGVSGSRVDIINQERVISAIEPILNRDKQIIGAVFMQVPELPDGNLIQGFMAVWLMSSVFWLLMMLPVGGLFGWFTTRSLLNRLHCLVKATLHFADGDYTQQIPVEHYDEVGQLEEHFNRMAAQLVESTSQQQQLAAQNARMSERNRIARDLHDSVKQQTFTIVMQLGAAISLFDTQPSVARQHLVEAENLTHQVQQELTGLIQELRPLGLQGKGLALALREFVTTWSHQRQVEATFQLAENDLLPPALEEALLRLTQEACANIARHSQANQVEVSLHCEHDTVILTVTDNGCGFDMTAVSGWGVGLHSMEERMTAFGGTMTVQSKIGEGTCVTAQCHFTPMPTILPATTVRIE